MHFTVHCDPVIDRRIERDLGLIRRRLTAELTAVRALVLVGGFGRGEGSVLLDSGEPRPMNDYDVVLIVEQEDTLERTALRELARALAREVDIWHVDLIPMAESRLSTLPFTMFNYDMKYGGYVFYGPPQILDVIPTMNPHEMPLEQGQVLLFNRLICMLECFSWHYLSSDIPHDQEFFLVKQCGKVVLACADALLLLNRWYHHSYQERARQLREQFAGRPRMVQLIEEATDFKLKPTTEIDADAIAYWFEVRDIYEDTFKDFVSTVYGRDFANWLQFSRFYSSSYVGRGFTSMLKNTVKRLTNLVVRDRYAIVPPKVAIQLAQLLVLFSLQREGCDGRMVREASTALSYRPERGEYTVLHETLRKECVRRWYERTGLEMREL